MLVLKTYKAHTTRFLFTVSNLRLIVPQSNAALRSFTKDYSSSDDEKETKKPFKPKQDIAATAEPETAAAKLNRLLASMKTDDPFTPGNKSDIDIARPGSLNKKRREAKNEEKANKNIFKAVKDVASMLGEDQQQQTQTESELLAKLLGQEHKMTAEKAANGETVNAAGKSKTKESDLSLSELIVGMKIDRNSRETQNTRSDYVRRTLAAAKNFQQQPRREGLVDRQLQSTQKREQKRPKREAETYTGSVNLFGAEPLGIFKEPNELKDTPDKLKTWSHLQRYELQLQVTHPPSNYYEKIALWTEQGKVWRFPIDNEQDWQAEEIDVDFSEHIFLEQHLENWCPNKGPIRHFMELVCVGLSKNPYLTAREKKEHILWYRDYFESKRELLKEYMQQEKPKQVEEAQ